uniref:Partial AB-hydrolase lipase domain-containing protein n=1 Tax=Strigamia maritima TaxID=126957 RepID=T1JGJ3_STRMM
MFFQIFLLLCSTLLIHCENLTELCYDIKQFKNVPNLARIYKLATSKAIQQIQSNGYPVEVHKISTNDGYRINIHRIPHRLTNDAAPVLILPGLGSSSTPYTMVPNGIVYTLANEGYDVWLGNFRCSFQDVSHIKYSQLQSKFWDFGMDEMALSDTPAMINHILQTTNQTKLSILSMSMSTATTTAMLAFKPELNNKVSRHVALAPVVYLHYIVDAIPYKFLKKLYDITGITDNIFSTLNKLGFYLVPFACSPFSFIPICKAIEICVIGYSPGSYGFCTAGLITSILRGTSLRTLLHFYQLITKKQLMQYDFGSEENLLRYGTDMPPIVDVSQITTPTSLIHSSNDPLASPLNVALLARKMKTAKVVLL